MLRFVKVVLAMALFMLAAFPAALLGAPIASAHSLDDVGASQAVLLDSPAVVRIVGLVQGGLVCHACLSDGSDIVSPQSGAFEWAVSGSGAFISPDGYILTADHVVDHSANNPGDVDFVLQAASQDIGQRYGLDPNTVLSFLENHASQVDIIVQPVSQTVFLSTAYTGQLTTTGAAISYPVTRIVVNSPVDQQDTAIIQVGAQDMPNLTLAQASDVSVGENITAIAFPADADQVTANGGAGTGDFTPLLNPSQSDAGTISSLLTSTVETGQITSEKTATGTLYYETSAIANHGSSGGPVVDDQGRIIGFVDQGSDTGRVVSLISSSVAASYVRQAGVTNSGQGTFETAWTKAVDEYDATSICHFTNAASDLSKLHTNYPQFGGIEPLLKNAQTKATPSDCPPPNNSALLIGGIGGGLVLIILVTLVVFLLRRRKQAQPVPVAAGVGYPASVGSQPNLPPPAGFSQPVSGQPSNPPMYPPGPAPLPPSTPSYNYGQGSASMPGVPAQPGQAYPSGPQAYQAAQASGASSPGYSSPQVAGSMPMSPQGGIQQPGVGHPSGPPAYPSNPSLPAYPQSQPSAARICVNGHQVTELAALFCPECGAPVHNVAYR